MGRHPIDLYSDANAFVPLEQIPTDHPAAALASASNSDDGHTIATLFRDRRILSNPDLIEALDHAIETHPAHKFFRDEDILTLTGAQVANIIEAQYHSNEYLMPPRLLEFATLVFTRYGKLAELRDVFESRYRNSNWTWIPSDVHGGPYLHQSYRVYLEALAFGDSSRALVAIKALDSNTSENGIRFLKLLRLMCLFRGEPLSDNQLERFVKQSLQTYTPIDEWTLLLDLDDESTVIQAVWQLFTHRGHPRANYFQEATLRD